MNATNILLYKEIEETTELVCEINFQFHNYLLSRLFDIHDLNKIGDAINAYPIIVSDLINTESDGRCVIVYDALKNILYALTQSSDREKKIKLRKLKEETGKIKNLINKLIFYKDVPSYEVYVNEYRSVNFNKLGKIYHCTLKISLKSSNLEFNGGEFSWIGEGYSTQEAFIHAYGKMKIFTLDI